MTKKQGDERERRGVARNLRQGWLRWMRSSCPYGRDASDAGDVSLNGGGRAMDRVRQLCVHPAIHWTSTVSSVDGRCRHLESMACKAFEIGMNSAERLHSESSMV